MSDGARKLLERCEEWQGLGPRTLPEVRGFLAMILICADWTLEMGAFCAMAFVWAEVPLAGSGQFRLLSL